MTHTCLQGDSLALLPTLPDDSIDSIVTDPPYELGLMGTSWDSSGIANNVALWRECLRVLKPGGHLLAFSGSRTYHRMTCAIEDAGFEIRDQIMWVYGSGFPKSLNVSLAIDKAAGARGNASTGFNAAGEDYIKPKGITPDAKKWSGWGTALKPAHEPICVARKPLIGTVAENVIENGTGAINIDACRVGNGNTETSGRWPANFIHDGSDEVVELFPETGPSKSGGQSGVTHAEGWGLKAAVSRGGHDDLGGSAARFFYCAKASNVDRDEGLEGFAKTNVQNDEDTMNPKRDIRPPALRANNHPTVKPTSLMRYLVRLVTPPGGTVLDPFLGSGSTGKACALEGFSFIGFDLSDEYVAISKARIENATKHQ